MRACLALVAARAVLGGGLEGRVSRACRAATECQRPRYMVPPDRAALSLALLYARFSEGLGSKVCSGCMLSTGPRSFPGQRPGPTPAAAAEATLAPIVA